MEKDGVERFTCRSAMIGRLPRKGEEEFKTVSIKLFKNDNAHKTEELPFKELEIRNIEKVRFRHLFVTYYLEGNDMILNHLEELNIMKKGTVLIVRGIQGTLYK